MPRSEVSVGLPALLGQNIPCTCGVQHVVPIQEVVLGEGTLDSVPTCCARHVRGKRALLVDDTTTHAIAGERLEQLLTQAGYGVDGLSVRASSHGRVVADEEGVDQVQSAIRPETDFLIAVGAGTVNDLVKLASFRTDRPYLVCPTAPSMNGFTSAIVAILSNGVKRTVPARPPVAVVADLTILATAPAGMRRAGLGDMLSKPVSTADWKLAHLIKGEYYCDLPLALVEQAERACRANAEAIGNGKVEGLKPLTEALLLSGISMVIAGSSSPASGGEHLLSHYWDMTAHMNGRQEHLHGAQVGVATLVTATLYEKLRQLDPASIDLNALRQGYPSWSDVAERLQRVHGPLGATLQGEARKKYQYVAEKEGEWQFILAHWQVIWDALQEILVPSGHLRQILVRAGAPTTIAELGISPDELRHAFLYARDIRGRYTVLDFAHDIGVLEGLCDDVIEASGVLG